MAASTMRIFGIFLLALYTTTARQIRINRFGKEIAFDVRNENENASDTEAKVTENKIAPYPAAGYRPGKSFNLPAEVDEAAAQMTTTMLTPLEQVQETTTSTPLAPFTTTTTTDDLNEITTSWPKSIEATTTEGTSDHVDKEKEHKESGSRPGKAFNFPNEDRFNIKSNEAPYPEAGYKPTVLFLLPNENFSESLRTNDTTNGTSFENKNATITAAWNGESKNNQEKHNLPPTTPTINASMDNSNHPVCGVSLNPLKPTPPPGTKDDPDAERVPFVTGVVLEPAPVPVGHFFQLSTPASRLIFIPFDPARSSFTYSTLLKS